MDRRPGRVLSRSQAWTTWNRARKLPATCQGMLRICQVIDPAVHRTLSGRCQFHRIGNLILNPQSPEHHTQAYLLQLLWKEVRHQSWWLWYAAEVDQCATLTT